MKFKQFDEWVLYEYRPAPIPKQWMVGDIFKLTFDNPSVKRIITYFGTGVVCYTIDGVEGSVAMHYFMKNAIPYVEKSYVQKDFETWLEDEQKLTPTWDDDRNCYEEFQAHLAWKAWQKAKKEYE